MRIVLEPYTKITIKSYFMYDNSEAFVNAITLAQARGATGVIGNLGWANGVLFKHYNFASTDSVTAQYLKGHLPLDHVEFASMPEYSTEIRSGDVILSVIDLSNHMIFGELTKWIKSNLMKRKKKN